MLVKRKPNNWFAADELVKYIEVDVDKNAGMFLENKLRHYQKYLPEAIRTWVVGKELKLCLDKGRLTDFCDIAHLKKRATPLNERKDLNIAQLLRYYVSGKHDEVSAVLDSLYHSGLPGAKDAIILRKYRAPAYHVYEDSIDWLFANSDLKRKKVPYHRGELTSEDLHKDYIQEDKKIIEKKLQELSKKMPESIYNVYVPQEGSKVLALRGADLEKFVAAAGLIFRPEYHGIEAKIVEPFYVKETVKQMLNLLQKHDDR